MALLQRCEQQSKRQRAQKQADSLRVPPPEDCPNLGPSALTIAPKTPYSASYSSSKSDVNGILLDDGTASLTSSQDRRLSSILRRGSFTSSVRLAIKRNLQIRFSFPSSLSTDTSSVSAASKTKIGSKHPINKLKFLPLSQNPIRELPRLVAPRPESTLDLFESFIHRVRLSLRDKCCSVNHGCIHKYIEEAIIGSPTPFYHLFDRTLHFANSITTSGNPTIDQINETYCHGHNALFFASSWQAPPRVISALLHYTVDWNQRDDNGRTFLYYIDAVTFQLTPCLCCMSGDGMPIDENQKHRSALECLIALLESRSFCFDQKDNDGRHFLSFFCASPYHKGIEFDVFAFLQRYNSRIWLHRVAALLESRDSAGRCLMDLRKEVPYTPVWVESIPGLREILNAHAKLYCGVQPCLAIMQDPYGEDGRTDLTRALEIAYDAKEDEYGVFSAVINCVRAKRCNVNARSRDGSTALIIAAKRNCPLVVEWLLSADADYTYVDLSGFTALDYAVENFRRSRRATAEPTMTSRSFVAATRLFERATSNGGQEQRKNLSLESYLRSGALGSEGERSLAVMAGLAEQVAMTSQSNAQEETQHEEIYIDGFEQPVSELAREFRTISGPSSLPRHLKTYYQRSRFGF